MAEARAVSNTVFRRAGSDEEEAERAGRIRQNVNQQRSALRQRINQADEKFHTRSLPQEERNAHPSGIRWETRWS